MTTATIEARPPTLMESLRFLPAPVWVLFGGMFVNKFGTFVLPFLTLYLAGKGFDLGDAGLALAAYGVGHFFAAGAGGYLADTVGRRKTIVISMAGAAVCMLGLSGAGSLPAIVALAALTGFTAELYRPAASALLIDLVPAEHRVTAFAANRLCFNAGWALGPATAGFLAKFSYFYLFVGEAVTCALFGFIAWFFLPRGVRDSSVSCGWSESLRTIRADRPFLLILATYLGIAFVFFQITSSYPPFVGELGFDERDYGLLLALNGLLIVAFELPLTGWTKRFRPSRVIAVGYALIGLGALATLFANSFVGLAVCLSILTFGEIVSMPISVAYVSQLAPETMRGRYMGAVGFTWATALTLAPAAGLRLLEASPLALWGVCGAVGLGAALAVTRLPRVGR